jgi:hypothetical protein
MADNYFEERFIEENFMTEDLGENPRPEWMDKILSHHQMIKDYEWVVENLNKLNSHTKKTKRMNL